MEATPEEISRYITDNKGSTIPVINVHGAITSEWYIYNYAAPRKLQIESLKFQYLELLHLQCQSTLLEVHPFKAKLSVTK